MGKTFILFPSYLDTTEDHPEPKDLAVDSSNASSYASALSVLDRTKLDASFKIEQIELCYLLKNDMNFTF